VDRLPITKLTTNNKSKLFNEILNETIPTTRNQHFAIRRDNMVSYHLISYFIFIL